MYGIKERMAQALHQFKANSDHIASAPASGLVWLWSMFNKLFVVSGLLNGIDAEWFTPEGHWRGNIDLLNSEVSRHPSEINRLRFHWCATEREGKWRMERDKGFHLDLEPWKIIFAVDETTQTMTFSYADNCRLIFHTNGDQLNVGLIDD